MGDEIKIRAFSPDDAAAVRELFIRVNRLLAPPDMNDAFEAYIAHSLADEIDEVSDYYRERNGGFGSPSTTRGSSACSAWIPRATTQWDCAAGVTCDPDVRRRGIARRMLHFAEQECRGRGHRMDLSTSALQHEALSLYRNAGYELVREEVAVTANNKTVGGGIRRYHFTRIL